VIAFQQVSKTFHVGTRAIKAVKPVDLHIQRGEIFGLIGYSGAGKSTLLRLINRLEEPTAGRIVVDGVEVTALDSLGLRAFRRQVGMIFQHFNLLASKTVAANVAMPMRLAGMPSNKITPRVQELLERVGIAEHAQKYPAQLSGGQKQRVGIARALATEPTILLCDEATSALDPDTTEQVLNLLRELNEELGLTIVLITHEMDVIRRICHRVGVMEQGAVIEHGLVTDVFLRPQHPTTQRFVQLSEGDESLTAADYQHIQGRILRLTFLGESTYAPVLSQVVHHTQVQYSILSGRIGRIQNQPCGQLTIAMQGAELAAAQQQLVAAGVAVEVLRDE